MSEQFYELYHGDCLKILSDLEDNSIDTVITDPPYGLSAEPDMSEVLGHWLAGDDFVQRGGGFMGKSWDSFVPGPSIWKEVYRVMKPGACLMAFGGTRTNDLLSIAIRLAGFRKFDEIDYYYGGLPPQIAWAYGQGFPKSHAIGKAIDKAAGEERETVGQGRSGATTTHKSSYQMSQQEDSTFGGKYDITAPATDAAALWEGYGTALKPAHEVILCFYKPREKGKWIVRLTPELLDEWEAIQHGHE